MKLKGARQRQKALRDANRQARRPDRDDVARVALFWLIRRAVDKGQETVSTTLSSLSCGARLAKKCGSEPFMPFAMGWRTP